MKPDNALNTVHQQIKTACLAHQRRVQDIRLLAVSKHHSAEAILDLYRQGQKAFAESYINEANMKIKQLPDDIEWHFIGPIQSNKTRVIAESFDWVHSVDRVKILHRLNEQCPGTRTAINICLQVNISGEENKSGCAPGALLALADCAQQCANLSLRGLMAIPEKTEDMSRLHAQFSALETLYNQLKNRYNSVDTLSAGMSSDFPVAVAHGSNLIRIGTALFGSRKKQVD